MDTNKDLTTEESWCEATGVGLRVVREPTWDQYQQEWDKWEYVHSISAWVLGDLLAFGELVWGDTYVQVAANTKYSIGYLRNIQYVCSNVPMANRKEELSMSHHQTAAKLDDVMQDAWLEYAVRQDLTRDEFRQQASNDELPPDQLIDSRPVYDLSQVIPAPEPPTLERIVVAYVRARRCHDGDSAFSIFKEMEEFVGDLL